MKGCVWCVWCVSPHPLVKTTKKLNGLIYSIVYARGKIRCCGGFMPALALFRDVPFCRLLVPHTGRQFYHARARFAFFQVLGTSKGHLLRTDARWEGGKIVVCLEMQVIVFGGG